MSLQRLAMMRMETPGQVGAEITLSYGDDLGNAHLLQRYGFVLPECVRSISTPPHTHISSHRPPRTSDAPPRPHALRAASAFRAAEIYLCQACSG